MSNILNKESPYSDEFEFFGQCHFMVKGTGSVSIERKMGKSWEVMTDKEGNPLTFVGEGVLFNSFIESRARMKHRLRGETATELTYEYAKER